jgi:hypothetical protein
MGKSNVIKSTQEQGVAAWINYLRVLRMEVLLDKLSAQDCNLESALRALNEVKKFISAPEHILGSALQKHGEVAEHMQVGISNARAAVQGLRQLYTFDGVGRLAMEDYLRDGQMIQSKFCNGIRGTFSAIHRHLSDYPMFIDGGGTYDIPRNQYAQLIDIYERGESARSSLMRTEETLYKAMKTWEEENSIQFKEVVKPAVVGYDDVQLAVADQTVVHEEGHIREMDDSIRQEAHAAAKPTLAEGAAATAVAAALEGGIAFAVKVLEKRKAGTKIQDFTKEDWKDVGLDTLVGTGKGAVRGVAIFTMTNYAPVPSPLASAMVTATFGVAAQARKLQNGSINEEDFIENCEVICLEVAVSALSSMLGEVLIPVPVLGTIIGNATGMFMYEISKSYLSATEGKLIAGYRQECEKYIQQLEVEYQALVIQIDESVSMFNSLISLVFDGLENQRLEASVAVAISAGVQKEKLLKNRAERDAFFIVE